MNKQELVKKYIELHPEHKKPFAGWDEAELSNKIAAFEGKPTSPIGVPQPVKTVTMTEEELRAIINGDTETRKNIFTNDVEPQEVEPSTPRTHTCNVVLYRKNADTPEGVVTGMRTLRHEYDKKIDQHNIDICEATITYEDGKTDTLEYKIGDHFKLFTKREKVEIIEQKDKKMKLDKGFVYKTAVKKVDGLETRMDGEKTNIQVPMREQFVKSTFRIRRSNGQEYTLNPNVINI